MGISINPNWVLLHDVTISSPVASLDFAVEGYQDILFSLLGIVSSAAVSRLIRASVDGGVSYYSASGDYITTDANGVPVNSTALAVAASTGLTGTNLIGSLFGNIDGNIDGYIKTTNCGVQGTRSLVATTLPITNLLVALNGAGNMTAGNIRIMGRI